MKVKEAGDELHCELQLQSVVKRLDPRTVRIRFLKSELREPARKAALGEEQAREFRATLEDLAESLLAEKLESWKHKPEMLRNLQSTSEFAGPLSSFVPYRKPIVQQIEVDEISGYGAFVLSEQLDHFQRDPQMRYELYVMKVGQQAPRRLHEAHGYVMREGDPQITIMDLNEDFVRLSLRDGEEQTVRL